MMDSKGQESKLKIYFQVPNSRNWYLIQTKAGEEQRAESNLAHQGVETFLPLYKTHQISFGRVTAKKKPLFPSYLFAKFELPSHYYQVKWTRGVSKIVAFGDAPVPVADEVIQAIKKRVGKDNLIELEEDWQQGDIVEIISGPLKGLRGILQKNISDKGRIKILLSMLGAEVSAHIPKWQLKRIANKL